MVKNYYKLLLSNFCEQNISRFKKMSIIIWIPHSIYLPFHFCLKLNCLMYVAAFVNFSVWI